MTLQIPISHKTGVKVILFIVWASGDSIFYFISRLGISIVGTDFSNSYFIVASIVFNFLIFFLFNIMEEWVTFKQQSNGAVK